MLDLVAPVPADTIVDVGCGNGTYLAELARRGCAGRVFGIDLSSGMLAAARTRLGGAGQVAVLANADATALPLRDGVADLTLAPHMLYHVPDPAQGLRELRRVTRPGGRVVIVLNGTDHLRSRRRTRHPRRRPLDVRHEPPRGRRVAERGGFPAEAGWVGRGSRVLFTLRVAVDSSVLGACG